MGTYSWESVRSGARSGVFIETSAGSLEAVEVMSGLHDDKLEDADRCKSRATGALVKDLFLKGRGFGEWLHVHLAALSDLGFPRVGKSYVLQAALTVKSPEVVSVLKALIPIDRKKSEV